MSALDKAKNKLEDLTGKAKEHKGEASGDDELKAGGKRDQARSDVKDAGENVKDAFDH